MTKLGRLGLCASVLGVASCASDATGRRPRADREASAISQAVLGWDVLIPTQLASSALTTAMLDATSAAAMGGTEAARVVLMYAVMCALGSTQTISFTVHGTTYSDTGRLGIAPGWTTSALSATEAAWVSSCALANVNAGGLLVWLSLRGAQSGLATTSEELTQYQIEEGAFWGNVFVNLGSIGGYSCSGLDQALDDTYADLPHRQCAQSNGVADSNASPCGMSYSGLCSSVCSTTTAPYSGCSFLEGPASNNVVTSFLTGTPD
jgi:hypothetical protein